MERSDWDDDEQYPAAPVPAHERAWRHPSEIGHAAWVTTEPPLALGRGLLVATGAIGGLLSLAVLWTMLPSSSGRSGVTALSTVAARSSADFAGSTSVASLAPTTTARPAATTTEHLLSSSTQPAINPTTSSPAPHTPGVIKVTKGTIEVQVPAVAVALGDGSVVVTTARAVGDESTVILSADDSTTASASVVWKDSNVALLSPDSAAMAESFPLAQSTQAGDHVRVMSDEPVDVTLSTDASGQLSLGSWDGDAPAEGTPVVNDAGSLVGLFSLGDAGAELVRVDNVPGLAAQLQQPTTTTPAAKVTLGVRIATATNGSLFIEAVDLAGPAAIGGVQAGDTLVAVDGTTMVALTDVQAILATHQPGDTVTLTVLRAGTATTLSVVLGGPPSI